MNKLIPTFVAGVLALAVSSVFAQSPTPSAPAGKGSASAPVSDNTGQSNLSKDDAAKLKSERAAATAKPKEKMSKEERRNAASVQRTEQTTSTTVSKEEAAKLKSEKAAKKAHPATAEQKAAMKDQNRKDAAAVRKDSGN